MISEEEVARKRSKFKQSLKNIDEDAEELDGTGQIKEGQFQVIREEEIEEGFEGEGQENGEERK